MYLSTSASLIGFLSWKIHDCSGCCFRDDNGNKILLSFHSNNMLHFFGAFLLNQNYTIFTLNQNLKRPNKEQNSNDIFGSAEISIVKKLWGPSKKNLWNWHASKKVWPPLVSNEGYLHILLLLTYLMRVFSLKMSFWSETRLMNLN